MNSRIYIVKKIQQTVHDNGMARTNVGAVIPRTMEMSLTGGESPSSEEIFLITIKEPEILTVSQDLFVAGFYSQAIHESFKALEKFISKKASLGQAGVTLMENVFSPNNPKLFWTSRQTLSEKDEQAGYMKIYAGAMQGIRNPVAHEIDWVDDAERALELIAFAQHLLRKAKSA